MKKILLTFLLVCCFLFFSNTETTYAKDFNLSFGTTYNGELTDSNPVDAYKITMTQAGRLTINIEIDDRMGSGDVYIEDTSGNKLIDFKVDRYTETYQYYLKAGTYYLKFASYTVPSLNYVEGGTYTVSVTVDDQITETGTESNDTLQTATSATFGTEIKGQISYKAAIEGDVDIYKIVLDESGKVNCNITSYLERYDIRLCDTLGNTIVSAGEDRNEAIGSVTNSYDWELISGTYYLKVQSYSNVYYGNYNFKLTFTNANETFAEPNNEAKTSNAISFDKTIKGQFALNDDSDVYKVSMTKKSVLLIDATTYGPDYRVIVTDANGKSVYTKYAYYDDNLGKTNTEHYVSVEKGTYYIQFFRNNNYGNFEFKASQLTYLEDCKIKIDSSVNYTGKAVKVPMTITSGSITLKEGTDYTTTYEYNTDFGTAYVTISGIGAYYGTIEKNFQIVVPVGKSITVGDYKWKFTDEDEIALVSIVNKKLTTVDLSSQIEIGGKWFSLTEISSKAAYNNTKLTKIILPSTLQKVGSKAFYGCTNLKSATFDSAPAIGKSVFTNCNKLTSVTGLQYGTTIPIGKNYYKMRSDGTLEFTKLVSTSDTSLAVPATVKIGADSFKVTAIASQAVDSTKIKSVTIGKNVSYIGAKAFYKCTSLTKVTFKGKNITVDADAFGGCKKLKTFTGGTGSVFTVGKYKYKLTSNSEVAFAGIKTNSKIAVTIPSTAKIGAKSYKVTAVADFALYETAVKSVTIGKSVKKVGAYAFAYCPNLTKVILKSKNITFGNYAFLDSRSLKTFSNLKGSTVIHGSYKYKVTGSSTLAFTGLALDVDDVYVNDTLVLGARTFKITSIADKALYKKNITSVTIGTNVTKIGKSAFQKCDVLSEINIKSKKLKSIGANAFKGIDSYATVNVPSSKYNSYKSLLSGAGLSGKATVLRNYNY